MKKIILASFIMISMIYGCIMAKERISSYPFIAGDTFRAIANHIVDETEQPFDPDLVKSGDIIFLKTDYAPRFFDELHSKINAEYILITHNSDLSPIYLKAIDHPWLGYDFSQYLDDPKLIVWFAQNIDYTHPKLKPLPIGVSNNYNKHGKVELFFNAVRDLPNFKSRANKIYLNFTLSTNGNVRQVALNFFKDKSYGYLADVKAPELYLEDLKHFNYVLSPEGNGVDCHRTWEALLMGCIPIVKHSIIDSLFEDLPVILVNDWHEVTEELLKNYAEEMTQKNYKNEKVYADYWINLIKSYQVSK